MHRETLPARLDLDRRALFALDDPSDVNFTCREGTVWLTLDGDLRDYVLEAGDSFRTGEHRRALIYALTPARLELEACGRRQPAALKPAQLRQPAPASIAAH